MKFSRVTASWSYQGAAEGAVRFSGRAFLLFFALCLAVNWPGRLNEDSLLQLIGFYDRSRLEDVHNPIVTWLWSLPAFLSRQPAGALVVQSALLSFYAAMLPRPFPRRGLALAVALAEAVFKLSLVIFAGFVIKDTMLIALLLGALACVQRASGEGSRNLWLVSAGLLLLLSLFVRSTNFVMLIAASALLVPLAFRGWRVRAAVFLSAAAALALIVPVNAVFNTYVVQARPSHAEVQLILFDASGISARTGRNLLAELPGWPAGLPDPRTCYRSSEAAIYAPWSPCSGYAAAGATLYSQGRKQMLLWWLETIAANPGAYLGHRIEFSGHLADPVGAVRGHPIYSQGGGDDQRRYLYALNDPADETRFRRLMGASLSPQRFQLWSDGLLANGFARLTNLFLGGRWMVAGALLAALLLLGWAFAQQLRQRTLPPFSATAAAALAVGNFAMHAAVGIGSQERYLYPTVMCAIFAIFTVIRQFALDRQSSEQAMPSLHGSGTGQQARP